MLLLFESPAGFALFKVLDEGKLKDVEDLQKDFLDGESAKKVVKLKKFVKFENTAEALASAASMVDSKLDKKLKKFLKKNCEDETLAIADPKLGSIIKEKMGIPCVHSSGVMELLRGVRQQLAELASGLAASDVAPMALGLSHSLSRYKLKFSPDKVDTMIVQAIGLLDDLDKELNTYAMRVREWYGWHFPEMTKIVTDNIEYSKTVKFMGMRDKAAGKDFSGILLDETEQELKDAAVVSMGTDVSDEDMEYIANLAEQVIGLSEYRAQLSDYLRSRMQAIAPNLTVLVGELVGARLIAHAGSLINLAKYPASTLQILGAEKALFRALKTKRETPKYGLIYHASLIGQSAPKFKGKMSRVLAAKCALSCRVDALGDSSVATIGIETRAAVEARLRQLEGRSLAGGKGKGTPKTEVYDKTRSDGAALAAAPKAYNTDGDVKIEKKKKKKAESSDEEEEPVKEKKEKKEKKEEKEAKTPKSEKKKKRKADESEDEEEEAPAPKSEKKKKKSKE